MSTIVDTRSRTDTRDRPHPPAYGPIEAVLGFVMFYVVVDRATPTIVDVVTGALSGVASSQVTFGLAVFIWFILAVNVIDQGRRQLAALGVGSDDAVNRERRSHGLSGTRALAYLAVLVVGGALAVWTFDVAIDTAVSMIRFLSTFDFEAFVLVDFVVMVVFFVSYGVATAALDRLVIGGIRSLLAQ